MKPRAMTVAPFATLTLAAALAPLSSAVAAAPDCRSDPFYEQKVLNGEPFFGCVLNGIPQGSYSTRARGPEGPIAAERGMKHEGSMTQGMAPAEVWKQLGATDTN